MAFRYKLGYLKTLVINASFQRGRRASFTNSTIPKMKPYAPTADQGANAYQQHHHRGGYGKSAKGSKADFTPLYVSIGMIALSVTFGLHTAKQQLMHCPQVSLKKRRRETVPEVVEPDDVVEDSKKLFKNSFFRKVAHIQDQQYNNPEKQAIPDSVHRDAFAYEPHVFTLKSVGVDPTSA